MGACLASIERCALANASAVCATVSGIAAVARSVDALPCARTGKCRDSSAERAIVWRRSGVTRSEQETEEHSSDSREFHCEPSINVLQAPPPSVVATLVFHAHQLSASVRSIKPTVEKDDTVTDRTGRNSPRTHARCSQTSTTTDGFGAGQAARRTRQTRGSHFSSAISGVGVSREQLGRG